MEEIKNTDKKETFRLILHVVFVVGMYIAVGALIYTTITIYRYRDMLKNPVGYNMEQFGLNYCTCYDNQQRIVPIKGLSYDDSFDKFIPKPEYAKQNYSFDPNKITFDDS